MVDIKEIKGYFDHGKLNAYPTKRKKQIIALAWISEHSKQQGRAERHRSIIAKGGRS